MKIALIILAIIAANGLIFLFLMGWILYSILLVRTSKKKWAHGPSEHDPEYDVMYGEALAWRDAHMDRMQKVSVKNGRLNLCGEYYDLGFDKAVILLPGRTETCRYSCFFAEPYEKNGYNVLIIDNRAHGDSDGVFNTLGFKEYKDVLLWAKMLHDDKGMKTVFLHGVCIGSSTACFVLASKNCPDYITGMTGEGMYTTFYATFLEHLIERGHKPFPMGHMAMLELLLFTGANVFTDGPVKRLPKVKKPVLMLHSREDIYSLPDKAERLYASLTTETREMVWFETGAHSRIRVHSAENRARYDAAISDFLTKL